MSNYSPERVVERLVAIRNALGMTKAEFADKLGIDRSSYTKIEAGSKPLNIEMGFKISEAYGVPLDYIYRGLPQNLPFWLVEKMQANGDMPL